MRDTEEIIIFSTKHLVQKFILRKSHSLIYQCAGSLLLGHNHPIFRTNLKKILKLNISNVASPNIYAEKFSKNLKKVITYSKLIFCNWNRSSYKITKTL